MAQLVKSLPAMWKTWVKKLRDFPAGAVGENPPANAGDMG